MASRNYHINRLIQDLNADMTARRAFQDNPAPVFEVYGVTPDERELLADSSIEAMGQLGVHPNLQMKWLMIRPGAKPSGSSPLSTYLDKLLTE